MKKKKEGHKKNTQGSTHSQRRLDVTMAVFTTLAVLVTKDFPLYVTTFAHCLGMGSIIYF